MRAAERVDLDGFAWSDAIAPKADGLAGEAQQQLPTEFTVDAQKLLGISLEGSVG